MQDVIALARAMEVLAPLIVDTIAWLRGGEKPDWMTTLPTELQSTIILRRIKARRGVA